MVSSFNYIFPKKVMKNKQKMANNHPMFSSSSFFKPFHNAVMCALYLWRNISNVPEEKLSLHLCKLLHMHLPLA